MAILFISFGANILASVQKFVHNINENPILLQEEKLFFPNLYKLHKLYILMDFYLVLLRGVYTRSSQFDGPSVKCP